MKRLVMCVPLALVVVLAFAPLAQAGIITHGGTSINMDFVTVANPGNASDSSGIPTWCGAVDYVYDIGKYEVSENQWDAVVAANTNDLLDDPGYWSGNQPVAHVHWSEVALFCNWLTSGDVTQGAYLVNGSGEVTEVNRTSALSAYGTVYVIPTVDEWYKAAYYDPDKPGGAGYYNYPTKSDFTPDGIDFNGDTVFDAVFDDGYRPTSTNDVDNAGVLSPYGTMGQGGNVQEWNETHYPPDPLVRGLRGGSYTDGHLYLSTNTPQTSITFTAQSHGLGFRVASIAPVPEPSSIAVWTLILLTFCGIGWRRRKAA